MIFSLMLLVGLLGERAAFAGRRALGRGDRLRFWSFWFCLRHGLSASAGAGGSHGRDQPFDPFDQQIDEDTEEGEREQSREGERRVELRGGAQQQEAQALARADEFADHRADHRERDRDLGAGEDERQRRRELHLEENLPARGARLCASSSNSLGVERRPAAVSTMIGKERDQPDDRELRFDVGAEPDQHDRRERHLGHRLQRDQQRIEHQIERARIGDRDRHRHAEHQRQRRNRTASPSASPSPLRAAGRKCATKATRTLSGVGSTTVGHAAEPADKRPGDEDQQRCRRADRRSG